MGFDLKLDPSAHVITHARAFQQHPACQLLSGEIALPVKGVVWYSKGLFNNGSHFINLLQDWLGDVREVRVIESGRWWGGLDPEPDLLVSFAHGSVCVLAAREEHFSHY